MGADLIIINIPSFAPTEAREAEFKACVMQEFLQNAALLSYFVKDRVWDTDIADRTNDELAEMCVDLVMAAWDEIDRNSRDVVAVSFEGMKYEMLLTGGMSWGDLPSESSECIDALGSTGPKAWKLMMKWARADFAGVRRQRQAVERTSGGHLPPERDADG